MESVHLKLLRFQCFDKERCHTFYGECLGMQQQKRVETDTHEYLYYAHPKPDLSKLNLEPREMRGFYYGIRLEHEKGITPPKELRGGKWFLVFYVRKLHVIAGRFRDARFEFEIPPTDFYGVKTALVRDPNGVSVRLVQAEERQLKTRLYDEGPSWNVRLGYVSIPCSNLQETIAFYHRIFSKTSAQSLFEQFFQKDAAAGGAKSPRGLASSAVNRGPTSGGLSGRSSPAEERASQALAAARLGEVEGDDEEGGGGGAFDREGFRVVDKEIFAQENLSMYWLGCGDRATHLTVCLMETPKETHEMIHGSNEFFVGINLLVPNLNKSIEFLKEARVEFTATRQEIRGLGTFSTFTDPNDTAVQISDNENF
eukprot:tig00021127_g18810.t1